MNITSNSISANIPSKWGDFSIRVWSSPRGQEPVALVTPNLDLTKPALVRVHSECITGDTFGSFKCDCGRQKERSLELISKSGNGVFIYLRQEGRGIGLFEKIKAYNLQEQGYDTIQANIMLGHTPDQRDYKLVKAILSELRIKNIKLITNNPSKINALSELGINVVERIPLLIRTTKHNKKYLEIKKTKMKHIGKKKEGEYYFGVSGITEVNEIEEIGSIINERMNDPFLRINIGISADSSSLRDTESRTNIEALYKIVENYSSTLTPILHYTFRNSTDYKKDLKIIYKSFPYIKTIQLNDLKSNHLSTLTFATKHFNVVFPIQHTTFNLIDNPSFVKVVKSKKVIVMIDNSNGRGIKEKKDMYMDAIDKLLEVGINNICLAGGFGPKELDTYFILKNYFRINFSIDAESKLRTHNKLDLAKTKVYLKSLIHPEN